MSHDHPGSIARWRIDLDEAPLVAVAPHEGHELRDEIRRWVATTDAERRREEDPFTAAFTEVAPTRVVVTRSRFEIDVNRPRAKAVYVDPGDAWDMHLYRRPLPADVRARSLELYDAFYRRLEGVLSELQRRHGGFVMFDCHSYNHRRASPDGPPGDPDENPEVNVGTGALDDSVWRRLTDRFMDELSSSSLDVRENVRFRGGHLSRSVADRFPGSGCCLALEFRKSFMDEWTGKVDRQRLGELVDALRATVPGVLEELGAVVAGRGRVTA